MVLSMVDPISVILGVLIAAASFAVLYAAYQYGARAALRPAHTVNMREIREYHQQDASVDALRQDVHDTESGQ